MEIELERTFLLKYIPQGLKDCKFIELVDIYIPHSSDHPHVRIRKRGDLMEITKKEPVTGTDSSEQREYTIPLNESEFEALSALPGKKISKRRYLYQIDGKTCEIDIFQENLKGLAVVDFEFKTSSEKDNFQAPDFCSDDVTQDLLIAGGYLAGKNYSDIAAQLKQKYNYLPLGI